MKNLIKFYRVWSGNGDEWEDFGNKKKAISYYKGLCKRHSRVVLDEWEGFKDEDGNWEGDYFQTLIEQGDKSIVPGPIGDGS